MSISADYPNIRPSLLLDFARSRTLDPRITFTRTTTATRVNEDGLIETVSAGLPRFDFDPTTLESKGLLIEEQRTNLLLQSQFASGWLFSNSSFTGTTTAPDGTNTGQLLNDSSSVSSGYTYQGVSVTNATAYAFSVFAKASGTTSVYLTCFTQAGGVSFTLTGNGTVDTPTGTFTNATIQHFGNGWYRCSVIFTATSTQTCNFGFSSRESGYTGDAFYIWGAQLEAGSFPTSYIPTTSAAATRNADQASMTGTNFSSWFNNGEGTLFINCAFNYQGPSGFPRLVAAVGSNANTDEISIYTRTTGVGGGEGQTYMAITVNGTQVGDTYPSNQTVLGSTKAAFAYKFNDLAATCFGLSVNTDTSSTIPVCQELRIYGQARFQNQSSGTISKIAYYPVRLTNTQLQALTR